MYQQITLADESKKYKSIVGRLSTCNELFAYNRLCYIISSAPGMFQRSIEQILQEIPGAYFLDDVILSGENITEHMSRLKTFYEHLNEKGLTVSKNKNVRIQRLIRISGVHNN